MEAFESGVLDLPDFYFTGDDVVSDDISMTEKAVISSAAGQSLTSNWNEVIW
jgi:hypothetical protein